jgi:hypothetical protein
MDPRRTQVVLQQMTSWEVKFFDVTECSWITDWRDQTIWEKYHSNMFVLGNAGNEDFTIDVSILGQQVVEKDGRMLIGDKGDRTFWKQTQLQLNVGLNILFWCHKKKYTPPFGKPRQTETRPASLID